MTPLPPLPEGWQHDIYKTLNWGEQVAKAERKAALLWAAEWLDGQGQPGYAHHIRAEAEKIK